MRHKKGWKAAILNFLVPGLGYIYARKIRRGIISFFLLFLLLFSIRFLAYNFAIFTTLVASFIVYYLYLIISAYKAVEKDKVYEERRYDKWYSYVFVILAAGILSNTIQGESLNNVTPINFASIPTPAMDPTLQVGDILAFEKDKAITRNDVVVFTYPGDLTTMYIKRCIGLPGDSLMIRSRQVFINGASLEEVPGLKYKYLLIPSSATFSKTFLEKSGINDFYLVGDNSYVVDLAPEEAQKLQALSFVKEVILLEATEGKGDIMVFPQSPDLGWNSDFYGPIYIPKKGDFIEMDETNVDIYGSYIVSEDKSLSIKDSRIYKDDKQVKTYQFRENYYFMMGDNRHNSFDSRFWGFLPEHLVIGKALYFYWSRAPHKIGKRII